MANPQTTTRIGEKEERRRTSPTTTTMMIILGPFQPTFLSNNVSTIVEDCEFSVALDKRDPCEDATTATERRLNSSLRKGKTTPRDCRPNNVEQTSTDVSKSPTKSYHRYYSLSSRSVPFLFLQFLLLAGLLRLAPTLAATSAAANARSSPLSVQQHMSPLVAMSDAYDENDVILTPISNNLMRQLGERRGSAALSPPRQRRSLANGRWGLRPGKRSAPSSEYPPFSAYPKTVKAHPPSTELLDTVVVAPAELMPKIYEGLQSAVVADAPSGAAASLAAAVSDEEWARKLAAAHENFRFFLVPDN